MRIAIWITSVFGAFAPLGVGLASDVPTRVATVPVCRYPTSIAIDVATDETLVACPTGALSVIEGRTNRTTTIPLVAVSEPFDPWPWTLFVDSTNDRVFLPNYFDASILMLDRATGERRSILVAGGPREIVKNSLTNKLYVTHPAFYGRSGIPIPFISVIDGVTLEAHDLQVGGYSGSIAVDEAGNRIYVATGGAVFIAPSDVVKVIDGATEVVTDLVVGLYPLSVAFDPISGLLAVASYSGSVSVVDGSTLAVRSVSVPDLPTTLTVNPMTGKIYVATQYSASVLEIDEQSLSILPIPVGPAVSQLRVNETTNTIYALRGSAAEAGTLTVIDGATHQTTEFGVGHGAVDIEVNPTTDTVWVVNRDDNTVTVLYGENAPCFRCPRLVPTRPGLR